MKTGIKWVEINVGTESRAASFCVGRTWDARGVAKPEVRFGHFKGFREDVVCALPAGIELTSWATRAELLALASRIATEYSGEPENWRKEPLWDAGVPQYAHNEPEFSDVMSRVRA